jgi:thiol-disulfide isomerase/thioredoxin
MRKDMKKLLAILILLLLALPGSCDWFEAQPEGNLPPDTEFVRCAEGQGVVEGSDVTFLWGGSDVDGRVISFEVSYDGGEWEPTVLDSMTVSGVTAGEHVLRVRAVDNEGEVDPEPAECSFTASAAGHMVDRTVLVELFTTNQCPNCPKAETVLEGLLAELGASGVSIVAYHDKPSYAPASDPLATDATDARIAWYTGNPEFPGDEDTWPTVVFDGLRTVVGVETEELAGALYRYEITTRDEIATPISLRLEGAIGADEGTVRAVVRAEDMPPSGSDVLRFVVIENNVKYRGIWASKYHFVARLILDDEALRLGAVGDSAAVERQFDVDPTWVPENLDVIAFVQDTGTMEVIQSGRLK